MNHQGKDSLFYKWHQNTEQSFAGENQNPHYLQTDHCKTRRKYSRKSWGPQPGKDFLDTALNAQIDKKKMINWISSKFKKCCPSKDNFTGQKLGEKYLQVV